MLLPSPVKPQVKKNTLYAERQPAERKQKPVAIVVLVQSEAGQRSRAWETRRARHAPREEERHAEAPRFLQFATPAAQRKRAVFGWATPLAVASALVVRQRGGSADSIKCI